jgi:hypothetical protein
MYFKYVTFTRHQKVEYYYSLLPMPPSANLFLAKSSR